MEETEQLLADLVRSEWRKYLAGAGGRGDGERKLEALVPCTPRITGRPVGAYRCEKSLWWAEINV